MAKVMTDEDVRRNLLSMKVTAEGSKVYSLTRVQCFVHTRGIFGGGKEWIIKKCPFCRKEHHHSPMEGARTAHCDWIAMGLSQPKEYYITLSPVPVYTRDWQETNWNRIRFLVFKRDNYHCKMCGRGVEDGVKLEAGHIIARAKGGRDDIDNVETLCFDCNHGMMTDGR